jgi:hypothetical protein
MSNLIDILVVRETIETQIKGTLTKFKCFLSFLFSFPVHIQQRRIYFQLFLSIFVRMFSWPNWLGQTERRYVLAYALLMFIRSNKL